MDKFEVAKPSAEQLTLTTAAVLSSAALFIASKGRLKEGLVQAVETVGANLSKSGALNKSSGQTLLKEITESGCESGVTGSYTGLSETGLRRVAEDKIKSEASAAGQAKLSALSNLDEASRPATQARYAQYEKDGFPLKSEITGQPLSRNEHHYAAWMDSLARKSAPEFHEGGTLLPGVYRMNMQEFRQAFVGDNAHRRTLADNLEEVLKGLSQAGVKEVHIGGSFVTTKAKPKDIDFIYDIIAPGVNRSKLPVDAAYNHTYALRRKGLELFVDPPADGSYKGMQYFFSHGKVEYPVRRRGHWMTGGGKFPKGIVELGL